MDLNWIDIFCGSLLLILIGLGAFFGLAKTIIHLIAWIGGGLGAFYASEILTPFLINNFNFSETTVVILTRVLGFLLPFFSLRIFGHFINKFIKRLFSLLNSLGGGFFGLIKGLIPCLILLSTLHLLPLSGKLQTERNQSKAYTIYVYALNKTGASERIQDVKKSVTESVQEKVNEKINEKINETVQEKINENF